MTVRRPLFAGSIVALVTPMKENGKVDYTSLKRLIDWHIVKGTTGIVLIGTTGESTSVSMQEHLKIVESALEFSDKRLPVIVGCSSPSTRKAIKLVLSLNELEPDGFLCVTPYYVKASQEGLYRHFMGVADACKRPLILYNVPNRSACDLKNETVIRLARQSNIAGLKDASGDISRPLELVNELGKDFCLLSGDDFTAFEFIKRGGSGVISVTANVAPNKMSQWCDLLLAGKFEKSQTIFDSLKPLHEAMFVESNPIPVKWALFKKGLIESGIRLPLIMPSIQAQKKIEKATANFEI